jgi:tetratricopeptide (TPR) repeat protein
MFPHALAVTEHAERLDVEPEATSRLLDRTATYQQGRAQFAQAKTLFQRALTVAETSPEPADLEIAARRSNLGNLLQELGEFIGAKTNYEMALPIAEAALGPDHFAVATLHSNLGRVLQALGDLQGPGVLSIHPDCPVATNDS